MAPVGVASATSLAGNEIVKEFGIAGSQRKGCSEDDGGGSSGQSEDSGGTHVYFKSLEKRVGFVKGCRKEKS